MSVDLSPLASAVNAAWISRYGGKPVTEAAALINRIHQLGQDRDAWLANARANQRENNRLESVLRRRGKRRRVVRRFRTWRAQNK